MTDIINETKNRMGQVIEHFKQDLRAIRAGRASPALVEPVLVEVYGSQMKLKELASFSVPEPRQLLVTPFDATNAQAIAKAIDKANLGVTAVVEGKSVRLVFPQLDQNRRKELIGQCHKKLEECKVAIRGVRRDQNEALKKQKSQGTLPEDDVKKHEKQIQDFTDKFCVEADKACQEKEKEISTV